MNTTTTLFSATVLSLSLAACGGSTPPPAKPVTDSVPMSKDSWTEPTAAKPTWPRKPREQMTMRERVVADFEDAVLTGREAYIGLFDFAAVGEYEILLHRYDLNGRLFHLDDDSRKQFAAEDGTPYPAERERRNVGNFYKPLAQRTVGTGGCVAGDPSTAYARLLGTFEPLPEGTPPKYETLRTHVIEWLTKGGVVGFQCRGGRGGLALVWTERPNARGYDLITIYDD